MWHLLLAGIGQAKEKGSIKNVYLLYLGMLNKSNYYTFQIYFVTKNYHYNVKQHVISFHLETELTYATYSHV